MEDCTENEGHLGEPQSHHSLAERGRARNMQSQPIFPAIAAEAARVSWMREMNSRDGKIAGATLQSTRVEDTTFSCSG